MIGFVVLQEYSYEGMSVPGDDDPLTVYVTIEEARARQRELTGPGRGGVIVGVRVPDEAFVGTDVSIRTA
jgi:hypothetical protein